MGIDRHGLIALEYVSKKGANFDTVCAIGRQQIQADKLFYKQVLQKTGSQIQTLLLWLEEKFSTQFQER